MKMKKQKSKDFIKGFKAGAYWSMHWADFQSRMGDFAEDLQDELYEMQQ